MNDADAESYFVRDVSTYLEGDSWRWTNARPELKFWLTSVKSQRFTMDFSVAEVTFKETGPVTISVYVNGRRLAAIPCAAPGDFHFENPVPSSWLATDAPTIVALQADKVYIAEPDGVRLGFILKRAGFLS
jgi:hypothetical protein